MVSRDPIGGKTNKWDPWGHDPQKKGTKKDMFHICLCGKLANTTYHNPRAPTNVGRGLWERHRGKKNVWRSFKQLEWQIWQSNIFVTKLGCGCQVPMVDDISKLEWLSTNNFEQISSWPVRWFREEPQNMLIVREYPQNTTCSMYMEHIPACYHKVKPNVGKYASLMERVGMPEQFRLIGNMPRYFDPPKQLDDWGLLPWVH